MLLIGPQSRREIFSNIIWPTSKGSEFVAGSRPFVASELGSERKSDALQVVVSFFAPKY